jgi:tetratricopeptide (TPR) repeat protein
MSEQQLPPNPFTRSPIKEPGGLAGRGRELAQIEYYLKLTAQGQCPHLALIGTRGVGKTSMLNVAAAKAEQLGLMSIRIDLNVSKAESAGRFWFDLYFALILKAAQTGLWGGINGAIYAQLFRMMNARRADAPDFAVLQFPYAVACHQGKIEEMECPDSLIVYDLQRVIEELMKLGKNGIVIIIDEADCMGKNIGLLQMFRNIFQTVDRCSLMLAGTEGIFPALSDVFSPIPRQFHRVDILPFRSWTSTMRLATRPFRGEFSALAPDAENVMNLHALCGGDPAEIQLYCHHMYRLLEQRQSDRMKLLPGVFKAVLKEYRANSSDNTGDVLRSIEKLPDALLYKATWLSWRKLARAENIQLDLLRSELRDGIALSEPQKAQRATTIGRSYDQLFELGIIGDSDHVNVVGGALTSGFWKSYVEVEKKQRWTWTDSTYRGAIKTALFESLRELDGVLNLGDTDVDGSICELLDALRDRRQIPTNGNELFIELIGIAAAKEGSEFAVFCEMNCQIDSDAGKQSMLVMFVARDDAAVNEDKLGKWLGDRRSVLERHGIAFSWSNRKSVAFPTTRELQRLQRILDMPSLPDWCGESEWDIAVKYFAEGNLKASMETFEAMLFDKDEPVVQNNLAFCELLIGDWPKAVDRLRPIIVTAYDPLFQLNLAMGLYLAGNIAEAKNQLKLAIEWIQNPSNKYDASGASYTLCCQGPKPSVTSVEGLPVHAAVAINLCRLGEWTAEEACKNILDKDSDNQKWLDLLAPIPSPAND